jgi:acyl-coenzyme A synthetase/AMP-(fatty) acid ligase
MPFYDQLLDYGERTALISSAGSLSYAALDEISKKIVSSIPTRSLVFCICKNDIASLAGYLGFLQKKIVPVLLSAAIDNGLLQHLIEIYRPQYIWAKQGFFNGTVVLSLENNDLMRTEYSDDCPAMSEELALLMTTSGSTGSPKLVRQTYRNIQANAESIVEYLHITCFDRPITTLPMHYTYGLSILNSHLLQGACILLTETTFMEKSFWDFLSENMATTFGGVPYSYEILKRLRFLQMDLPSLKYLTQAGGKLGKELHYEFASKLHEKGLAFIAMYGQTEATARISYVPNEHSEDKAGSIGIPIPKGRMLLIDNDGTEILNPHTVGELVFIGPNVAMGYAECRDDLLKGNEWHNRLYTGDMAQFDEDRYFYIVGRKKRFLKIFGSRINMDELETLLLQNGYECAVTGIDDHMQIFTTTKNVEQVRNSISSITSINRSAFSVRYIEKLIRNEAGKLLYADLPN